MISRLQGILVEKQPPFLILDVQGVGYEVEAPMSTFYCLPECGEKVILHTHFVVREDGHYLFGFAKENERKLFRSLIKVNGIGPKVALSILSALEPDLFMTCILSQDEKALIQIPGIGKKMAQRLLVEMQDRVRDLQQTFTQSSFKVNESSGESSPAHQDAMSALIALGYRPMDAHRALAAVADEGKSSQELIRLALKQFAVSTV